MGALLYAGSDPYGGTGTLVFSTAQARRRALRVVGPLDDERGRLAALLHIAWLAQHPAGEHVLAAQRAGLPHLWRLAEQTSTRALLTDAAGSRATLAQLRAALRGVI